MVMSNFASTINKQLPQYHITVNATGAATKHVLNTAKGKTDYYMTSPTLHHLMSNQLAMYKKIKNVKTLSENLRAVFNFPMGLYQSVVYADSGIHSMSDIKGKRVFAGPPGGVARRTVETMINAVTGLKAGKDYTSVKLGWDSASQAFQDKNIDVYFNPTNAPSPTISQIALTNKVRFLGIPKQDIENNDIIKKLIAKPGYKMTSLAADAYGANQVNEHPVYTIGVTVGIATNAKTSKETIYHMTKAFWENIEQQAIHSPWLRSINLDSAFEDMNMPLHQGAQRYYQEIGLLK